MVQDDAAGNTFGLRKNGNSNNENATYVTTQVANVIMRGEAIVACDSNRIVEYYASNTTWTAIGLTVRGWWF